MKQQRRNWLVEARRLGLAPRCALVSVVVAAVYGAFAPVVFGYRDALGLTAAGVAAGGCLAGAIGALTVSELFTGSQAALYGFLTGMLFRMGVPLTLAVVVAYRRSELLEAGFGYYLIVAYLVTLGAEMLLSLPTADADRSLKKVS